MSDPVRWAAVALALVFVIAAITKAIDLKGTAEEFSSLRIRRPELVARLVIPVEVTVAAMLLLAPSAGATVAFALLAGLTTVLVGALRSGREATCRCFGALSARPISRLTVARNGALMALSALVALG